MSDNVQEKRDRFLTKQEELAEVFRLAKTGEGDESVYNFSDKEVLTKLEAKDANDAMQKVRARNTELENLGTELRQAEAKHYASQITKRADALITPGKGSILHPDDPLSDEKMSLGQRFVRSKQWKQSKSSSSDIPLHLEMELKTLFQTTAGFAPESIRSGLLVAAAVRPIQVMDLIPSFPINQASFVYMEETTRVHSAAEAAEGASYAESQFQWTQKTSTVRKIADSIPITDEQLEDESQVSSLLDQRLMFGLRQRLDGQILVGDGLGNNLTGINNVAGIQTQAKGTDDRITAFAKALTLVRFTGRAIPSAAVFHPNDWLAILLIKDANGQFLFGNPFSGAGPTSLLGIPISQSDAQTEGAGLVGDFQNFSRLDDRRGVVVQTGFVGTQFTDGKVTLRADLRTAFTVTRPAAFCQITGI